MRVVQGYTLAIGHRGDTRDYVGLRKAGVVAIVDLAVNELPLTPPREMVYCRFPMVDGAGNTRALIRGAIEVTTSLVRSRVMTLVMCSAGMSRSPAIAAGAIAVVGLRAPGECLVEVTQGAAADVSPGFWGDVVAVVAEMRR